MTPPGAPSRKDGRRRVGADADHLKTTADIDACAAAGFTFFTIDPGEHVDGAADTDDAATLGRKYDALPWLGLETSAAALRAAYVGKRIEIEDRAIAYDDATLLRGGGQVWPRRGARGDDVPTPGR